MIQYGNKRLSHVTQIQLTFDIRDGQIKGLINGFNYKMITLIDCFLAFCVGLRSIYFGINRWL
jgi:hypothetical protein